jgi:hypothetical protein
LEISVGEASTRIPFLQLGLDVTRGHASRIQGQDFIVEADHSGLALFDELR